MEEEVVLGRAVGQGAVVRVAHGDVEGEKHRLAGVDGGRGLALRHQRGHGACDFSTQGARQMGRPDIWRQETDRGRRRMSVFEHFQDKNMS